MSSHICFKTALAIVLLASGASAFSVLWRVTDFNSFQPVALANVTLYNSTGFETSTLTDANGEGSLSAGTQVWSVGITRSGYFPYDSTLNLSNDTTEAVSLNPSSTSGIVRFIPSDLTLGSGRRFIVVFADNGRLQGVYGMNDTVTLHVNMRYVIIPQPLAQDLVATPRMVSRNWNFILPYLAGFGFVFALIALAWRAVRKK